MIVATAPSTSAAPPAGPRAARRAAGLTPAQVGDRSGYAAATILAYERAWERRAAGDRAAASLLPCYAAARRIAAVVPGCRVDDWYRFPSGTQNAAGEGSPRRSPSRPSRRPARNGAAALPSVKENR